MSTVRFRTPPFFVFFLIFILEKFHIKQVNLNQHKLLGFIQMNSHNSLSDLTLISIDRKNLCRYAI